MRRATVEPLMSALGVLALVGALVVFDPRVRDQVSTIISRDSARATLMTTVADLASAVILSVRDQSLEHAPLVVFGVAAAVLVTFMLRT